MKLGQLNISKKKITQLVYYQLGGGLYFWSAWVVITFGSTFIGLWWANIVGNAVGITLNFLVQRYVTFSTKKSRGKSSWRFIVLTLANIVLSYILLRVLTAVGVPLWLAQFMSAGLFTVWNWLWYTRWVFKQGQA